MMQLVRMVMSLTCLAGAGGIVLAYQADRAQAKGEPAAFVHGEQRLDDLMKELGVSGDGAADVGGPELITNETIATMARQRWSALRMDPMAAVPAETASAPPGSARKPVRRTAHGGGVRPRSAFAIPGRGGQPRSIWERTDWRNHTKVLDRDRDLRRKSLRARSRVGEATVSPGQRAYAVHHMNGGRSVFEQSRRYKSMGSRYNGLRRRVNPSISRRSR